jgi:hypothetical protein
MAAQLSTIRYREDSRGLTEIESKDQGNQHFSPLGGHQIARSERERLYHG